MRNLFVIPIWIVGLVMGMTTASHAVEIDGKQVLVIGRITENLNKHYGPTKAMADYLAAKMKDLGVEEGRVVLTADAKQLIQYMKEGRVDIINDTVFNAARL